MNSDKTESKIMNNNKQQNIQKGNSLKKKGIYKIIFLSTIIIIKWLQGPNKKIL